LCRYWQGRALQEALSAKETFLRGITHQLRTPIHGILGSVELLTEELKARDVVHTTAASSPTASPEIEQLNPYTYIKTIKTSARELISTVNSLIKLNQWADIAQAERVLTMHTVSEIENSLLKETLLGLSDDLSRRPSIVIQHRLPPSYDLLIIDMRVFLDCIQPLMVNAAQNAAGGIVAVTLSIKEGCRSLIVDVEHNGHKTPNGYYDRVFDSHGKIDLSSTESTLGLTLASKAAILLGGEITMLSSTERFSSHFKATFNEPVCACSLSPSPAVRDRFIRLPPTFHHLTSESATSSLGHYFAQYLSDAGWLVSTTRHDSFVIVDYTPNLAELYRHTSSIGAGQVAICLVPECACFLDFHTERVRRQGYVVYVQGPFLSETFEQALEHADAILAEFPSSTMNGELCATGGVAIEPAIPLSAASPNGRPELPPERGSIFPEKLQKELVQSVQSLHIQARPSVAATQVSASSIKPFTLLVDDNRVNLRLLEMYCSRRGIPYRSAKDGQQAVDIFSKALAPIYDPLLQQNLPTQPFRLILMDLQMPVCDGIDATRQIRQLEKQHGHGKSVLFIVTGQDSSKDRKAADEAGADEFLTKPVGPKVLDQWVKKWYPDFDI
jgi:CheY-like chemotaxis protein